MKTRPRANAERSDTAMKLDALRREIDRIDRDIVRLLNARTRTAVRIGQIKKTAGLPVYVAPRERAVLDRVARTNRGPLPDASLHFIYREIMSAARAVEGGLTVACTRISERAARSKFGDSVSYLVCPSPRAAQQALQKAAQLAVVPEHKGTADALERFEEAGRSFLIFASAP